MADVKISQLPAASTPLAGTEQIPLVQDAVTKQITVSNLLTSANLGTPSAVNLANATNVPMAQASGTLAVNRGGTGTTTPALVAGTNVTISGSWPNQTINSTYSGAVTSVTGTAPVVSSGGTTPAISMPAATGSVNGYLTSTDWTTFNSKQPAGSYLTNGGALGTPSSGTATNLTGLPLSTGVTGLLPVANGGTGTATPALVAGSNVTISGTWPNQTIAAAGAAQVYPGAGIANSTGSAWGTSYTTTGSGTVLALATSPTFVTPVLGTPTSGNFSTGTFTWPTFNQNTTGTAAGLSATLAVASGGTGQTSYTDGQLLIGNSTGNTLTKATLTAGANITITNSAGGITIAAAGGGGSGTVTSVSGTGTVNGLTLTGTVTTSGSLTLGGTLDLSSPPAIGGTTAAAGSFTTLTTSSTVTVNGGTANGVTYLNGSKVLTSGSALTFDGTNIGVGTSSPVANGGYAGATFNGTNGGLLQFQNNGTNKLRLFVSSSQSVIDTGTGILNILPTGNLTLGTSSTDIIFQNGTVGELARFTTTGLGIGTSSPSYKLQVNGTSNTVGIGIGGTAASGDNGIYYNVSAITGSYNVINAVPSASTGVNVNFGNGNSSSSSANTRLDILTTGASGGDPKTTYTISGVLNWCVGVDNSDSDKFKISGSDSPGTSDYLTIDTSGNVLVGTTSVSTWGGKVTIQSDSSSSGYPISINNTAAGSTSYAIQDFYRNVTRTGTITNTNTATAYNTSSDYRLKNTIAPMTGALAKVAQLKPVTYKWNVDGSNGEGFIAHELAEVVPQAVHGEKDAVNEDGSINPQGIDTSFLVATLTAAIQELKAEFDAYKASHP